VVQRLQELTKEVEKEGFRTEFYASDSWLPVINPLNEANHVIRVAEQFYGKDKVGVGLLPVRSSEDFSYFCTQKPGAFFFLTSGKTEDSPMIHSNNFDFNDDLIEPTGKFWLALVRDRFELA